LGVEKLNRAASPQQPALYAVENAMMGVLEKALHPLVRLCLRNGVTYNAASGLLKQVFIHSALQEEVGDNPRSTANISRVALRTAINRAEVKQLVEAKTTERIKPEQSLIEAHVLERWVHDPAFSDEEGNPRPLPLTGRGRSFQKLCQKCGTNISYGVIAKSLETAGNIEIRGMDRVVYQVMREYTPKQSTPTEMLSVIETSIDHFLATIEHNATREKFSPPFVQRLILSTEISKSDIAETRKRLRKLVVEQKSVAVRELDDLESESLPDDEKMTAGIGYFYFER